LSGRSLLLLAAAAVTFGCARGDDGTRFTIWADMEPGEQAVVHDHLRQYEAAHPGTAVEILFFEEGDLRNQFITAALARTGPDLVYAPSDHVGPYSIMGLIEPLDGLVAPDTLARFDGSAKVTLEGHVYALADQIGNHLTLGYNAKLVDHAPATTEEWIAMAKRLTVDRNGDGRIDQYGIVMNITEPFWLVPWLGAYGGWVMDDQLRPTLDTEAMREALRFFQRLLREGVIPPGCDYQLAETLFKEGSAAFIVNGPWAWASYRDAGIDVALGVLPPVEGGGYPTPMTACKAYSMNRFVADARRAAVLDLLEFLTSREVVADVSHELGVLPSRLDVTPRLDDPLVPMSLAQLRKGRLMPVVPEMRVLWDVMRPGFQQTLGGKLTPEQAATWMQAQAVRKIEELRL
jgi:maltose-binding protein MalE